MSDLKITVPDMGDFKDVEIIEVLVKEGETINKNDSLITLESDKSSVEVPSTESGIYRIALAADEGHWSWIEAKAILSNLYLWVENDPILALEHAKDLASIFPNNFKRYGK